jgi:hypothetical protein
MWRMTEREQILASVEGSHRLEELPVSAGMSDLLARWSRGEVAEGDLRIAERRLLAREGLAEPGTGASLAAMRGDEQTSPDMLAEVVRGP